MTVFRHILIFMTLLSAVAARGQQSVRNYHDDAARTCRDTMFTLSVPADNILSTAIEVRGTCAPEGGRQADASSSFGIAWSIDSTGTYYRVMLAPDNRYDQYDDITENRYVRLLIEKVGPEGKVLQTLRDIRLSDDVETVRCENSLAVEIDGRSGRTSILAGDKQLQPVTVIDSISPGAVGIISRGKASFSLAVTETMPDKATALATEWTADAIENHISGHSSPQSPVGYWHYLDRDNDSRYARLGGEYRLAIVENPNMPGAYDIIYLGGATVGASSWHEGMLKGQLHPTGFGGHYNLVWYDASMNRLDSETSATVDPGSSATILRLDFPLLKTSVRLTRTTIGK